MYVSAVVYPLALVQQKMPEYVWLVQYNPLVYIIETTRYMLLDVGEISLVGLMYTSVVTVVILLVGIFFFNKTEKSFIDTV
jgi:lipopolysaccharide transport system permease protein